MIDLNKYKRKLFSPHKSLNYLSERYPPPEKLYKYQSFYTDNTTKNKHWEENLNGQFHLSLACDFEDPDDCKPHIDFEKAKRILGNNLKKLNYTNYQKILDKYIVKEDTIPSIIQNYKNEIRIGCFTDSPDNEKMWEKYAGKSKGYCIEYDTSKHKLFKLSTLPVLYSREKYDLSWPYAHLILRKFPVRGNLTKSYEKKLERNNMRILKMVYVPLFIKNPDLEYEKEYRMFLLKRRTTREGMITMDEFLDKKTHNIDLSKAITAIYLGEKFDENKDSGNIMNKIEGIAQSKNIAVYKKIGSSFKKIY